MSKIPSATLPLCEWDTLFSCEYACACAYNLAQALGGGSPLVDPGTTCAYTLAINRAQMCACLVGHASNILRNSIVLFLRDDYNYSYNNTRRG